MQTPEDLLRVLKVDALAMAGRVDAYFTPTEPPVVSPTGSTPRLLWTPKRQTTLNRMFAEATAGAATLGGIWGRLILSNAAKVPDRYADAGEWATLAFQGTGDTKWIEWALHDLEGFLAQEVHDGNGIREHAGTRVVMLDWLWPGLTPEQRTRHLAALDRMFTTSMAKAVRMNDSDQVIGVYLGLLFYKLAFGDRHAPAADFWERTVVGGFDSTARDRTTFRNCIRDFVEMGAGGPWIEGTGYEHTVRLLMWIYYGALWATGEDHFPEIAAWIQEGGALRNWLMTTPDLKAELQVGDNEHPRSVEYSARVEISMCIDHPVARSYVIAIVALRGATGTNSAETFAKGHFLFDPYGPAEIPTELVLNGSGQGIVSARSSGASSASMIGLHCQPTHPNGAVDHDVRYFADWQFYQGGRWMLTHPITYSGVGVQERGTNTLAHRGMTPMEWAGANSLSVGNGWVFYAGTTGGITVPANYQPPETFIYEYSRSVLCIWGQTCDLVIVHDRSHAIDPLPLRLFSRYSVANRTILTANPLRVWRTHVPRGTPVPRGRSCDWAVDSGRVRVTWLRDDLVAGIFDQVAGWPTPPFNMLEKEKNATLELAHSTPGFVSCIQVFEFSRDGSGWAPSIELVTFPGIDGVRVNRDGTGEGADVVALFNAEAGPVLPSATTSRYDPAVPGLLAGVRRRSSPFRVAGEGPARVWWPETAADGVVHELA